MTLIALVGIDGCGKSTQARRLAGSPGPAGAPWAVTSVWDILADETLDTGFTGGPEALRAYLSQLSSTARCLFIFHALSESFRRARAATSGPLVAVGYTPKYAVVERLLGTPGGLVEALEAQFPRPDRTLWLDLDPEVAAARKPAFTRYECGGELPSPGAFARFQARCKERLSRRAEALGWVRIDAAGEPDQVHDRLREALERER